MVEPSKIAVTNQKGGVGKTAMAINVAGALNARGRDVLFVDLDPQGNATENWGHREAYDAESPTLFDILTNADYREAISKLVVQHEEVDLIPSSIDMTVVEPELTLSRRPGEQLAIALSYVEDEYDYVIVDCPPFMGNLMDNALYAARNVLIPALAEDTSKRAFELLFDHIELLEGDYTDAQNDLSIKERGVIVNRIDVRKNQANEMVEWIESAFEDVPVWRVRERADVQRALSNGGSLFTQEPESDQLGVFEDIARSLDDQFEVGT